MSERLSLVTCTSCGKPIPPGTNPQNSSAPTAEKSRLNGTGNAANSDASTNVQNAGFTGP